MMFNRHSFLCTRLFEYSPLYSPTISSLKYNSFLKVPCSILGYDALQLTKPDAKNKTQLFRKVRK